MRPGSLNNYRAEWDRLARALTWKYGAPYTRDILAGRDANTNADIARWRSLGERKRASR